MQFLFFQLLFIFTFHLQAQPKDLSTVCLNHIEKLKQMDFDYGWVQVPLLHDQINSEKIEIFYYYNSKKTLDHPVLFINGGPGQPSHSSAFILEQALTKFNLNDKMNLIYFDQRNQGCSENFEIRGTSESAFQKMKWSGTSAHIFDAEYIRRKILGENKKWKIFGQSYGAYSIYRYLELFPESVQSAVAHGYALGNNDLDFSVYKILAQHKVVSEFYKKHPLSRKKVELLKSHFSDPEKCYELGTSTYKTCGFEIITHFVYSLGFKSSWPSVSHQLDQLFPQNEIDEIAITTFFKQLPGIPYLYNKKNLTYGLDENTNFTFHFLGLFDWDSKPFDSIKCQMIYDTIQKKYKTDPRKLFIHECLAPLQFNYIDEYQAYVRSKSSELTPLFVQLENVKRNLKNLKIPVYVFSGNFDSVVPKEAFDIQKKNFGPLMSYQNLPNSGHEGFYTELAVLRSILR